MNFEELQTVWDAQKGQTLFALDKDALQRVVDKDATAIRRDLKLLELAAIAALIVLGIASLVDTFFNGNEYFQLGGVAFDFVAAGYLWKRRRSRESVLEREPETILARVESAIKRASTTIECGRDLAIVFALFGFYGVGIRMMIYGWRGSEIKLALSIVSAALLFGCMKFSETTTHRPRINNLDALRSKLLNLHE